MDLTTFKPEDIDIYIPVNTDVSKNLILLFNSLKREHKSSKFKKFIFLMFK